jgi:hypothetical protein
VSCPTNNTIYETNYATRPRHEQQYSSLSIEKGLLLYSAVLCIEHTNTFKTYPFAWRSHSWLYRHHITIIIPALSLHPVQQHPPLLLSCYSALSVSKSEWSNSTTVVDNIRVGSGEKVIEIEAFLPAFLHFWVSEQGIKLLQLQLWWLLSLEEFVCGVVWLTGERDIELDWMQKSRE